MLRKKITVKVTPSEFEKLDKKRGTRGSGTTLQDIGAILFLAWERDQIKIEHDRVISGGAEYPYEPTNKEWHDVLETVLHDPVNRLGIVSNLQWAFASAKRGSGPQLLVPGSEQHEREIAGAFLALEILRARPIPELQSRIEKLFHLLSDIAREAAAHTEHGKKSSKGKKGLD